MGRSVGLPISWRCEVFGQPITVQMVNEQLNARATNAHISYYHFGDSALIRVNYLGILRYLITPLRPLVWWN
jgi:hypothetical protein